MSTAGYVLSDARSVLAGAVIFGLLGGYAFHRVWRQIVPRSWTRVLWQKLPNDVRAMLASEDPTEMMKHYRTVLAGISLFAARNALGLCLALIPLGTFFLLLTAWDPSGRVATTIEAHPAAVLSDGSFSGPISGGERLLIERHRVGAAGVRIAGHPLDAAMLMEKHAFCSSIPSCLLFDMMLFETHSPATGELARSVVVRPAHLDRNPFWPYLNDLDFWFFLAAMAGSGAAALLHKRNPGHR